MPTRGTYRAIDLRGFLSSSLTRLGVVEADANICADIIIDADLRGVDTHGIANFVWHLHYGPGLRDGYIKPQPDIEVLRDMPVAAAWDADRGFGPLVAHRAMSAAIDKANTAGIGMVTVRNGCHFGAHAYFVDMAAAHGMIGMTMTHTVPAAVAPNGLDLIIGTNPIGIGVPSSDDHNFVLDMSTTAISGTKAMFAQRSGSLLPPMTAVDAHGIPTTDASSRAGLLPLGSMAETGGGKGFGLALFVDIVSGLMSGTGSGLRQRYGPDWGQGYWFLAWRVDLFVDLESFQHQVAELSEAVRTSRPTNAGDPVRMPGDRAATTKKHRSADGVALNDDVVALCETFAAEIGVPFPPPVGTEGRRPR